MRTVTSVFLLLAMIGSPCATHGQGGYHIELTLVGAQSGKVVMALQTTEQLVVVDSLPLFSNGSYRFQGSQRLAPGQYTFIQNDRRLFNFLISFEKDVHLQFNVRIDNGRTTEITANGDEENEAYIRFQRFIQDTNRKPNLTETDISNIDRYTDSLVRQYPNTLLAIIASNISTPPLPQYMFLNDRRVLHTSILPIRIQSFFTNVVPPQPEFVIPQIDTILTRCTDPYVKEWCGAFMLNYFLSSNIMGMENAAIHIAKKYINGEIKPPHSDLIAELNTYVSFNEHSLIGMPAPELYLPNAEGRRTSLRNLDARFVILLFYDEDCPVCREVMPEIDLTYRQFRSNNVKVYAVYTQDRYHAWRQYALSLNPEWISVWDPDFSSRFHQLYNVTGTPKIYLLDQNKTIIARGVDPYVLQQILSYQLN